MTGGHVKISLQHGRISAENALKSLRSAEGGRLSVPGDSGDPLLYVTE